MTKKALVPYDFPSVPLVNGATTWFVTPTGTNATGTWGISISGNAATATNVAWSGVTSKPTTLAGYGITDGELRHANGVPRSNLGDPTVREMAVFDAQFGNKTDRTDIVNVTFETSTDGINWTNYTVSDTEKRRFVGGDITLSNVIIPNGTAYFRVKFRAVGYSYLNALYSYFSTNGNSTKVTVWRKHDSGSLEQHTNSTTSVSSWPGHLYLPFTTIPFNQNATLGTHFHEVYALFTPTWNNANNINLYNMSWWGGYPAGRRNLYTTDEFGNAVFPAAVSGATAAVGTNTTQLATTAFVNAEIANDAVTLNTTQTVSGQKTFSAASTLFTGNAAFDMRVLASTLDTAAPSIQSFNTKPLYLNPQGNAVYIGSNIALHAGNYTSYSPSLTGTGASGTWGISISGNAATLTNFTTTTTTTVGDENTTSAIGYVNSISLFGQSDGALYSHVYSSAWKHQIFADYRTGQLAVRGKNNGTWQSWRTVLDSGNYDSYARTTVNSYFGSPGTEGTLDWNHVSNTKPGATGTLLLGTATNGMGGSVYYHPFNIEYATKDGTGNVTQMAISYSSPANELYMRGRYNGTWSGWVRYLNSNNFNTYAPTLTGTGASGTWGISVTGNANTVDGYHIQVDGTGTDPNTIYLKTTGGSITVAWSDVTGKPTTVQGYGITNALRTDASSNSTAGVTHTTVVNSNVAIASLPNVIHGWNAEGNGTGPAVMTFHRPGAYAAHFGLDTDNKWKVGGWSMGAVSYELLHAGNYTSYAATSTHTHGLGRHNLSAPANIDGLTNSNFRTTLFGSSASAYQLSTARWDNVPAALTGMAMYSTMLAWAGADTHGFLAVNYNQAGVMIGGGNGDAISWSKTLAFGDGTGASGTWGINITGNAATATNATQLGGVSSSRSMLRRRVRINSTDGTSLDSSIAAPEFGFTYGGSGEPQGPYISFGGLFSDIDYSCQLVGGYNGGGNNFKIRTRDGDAGTWNAWRTIVTDGNYTDYTVTKTGTGASGTWGISVTGNAATVTNGVYTTGNQTIAGNKTFSGTTALTEASTVDGVKIGFRNVPVNLSNAALTLSAAYDGECIYKNNTTAYTYTIPDGLPDGTVFTIANCGSAGNITLSMSGTEVLRLAGTTSTGARTIAPYGEATVHRVGGMWLCGGAGVT